MAELPQGTVTFVLTDMRAPLACSSPSAPATRPCSDHRRRLRAAFSSHECIEVDTQGDACFYAFAKTHPRHLRR